jgi:4-hydroxy-2-oxoheptanedioate aldolase
VRTNTTKAKLKAGGSVFGCFVRYADASLVELLTFQGWDFLVFDAEHGTVSPRDCEHMVRAAELHDITPLVRVTANQAPVILRYMDTGAQGLHIPWVNSAADADAAVRSVKFQPRGTRGLAGSRAADFSQTIALDEYAAMANRETLVVAQIETIEAVERLPSILAVSDIDVMFIGPTDLSHSLGLPGNVSHPAVQLAMQRIVDIVVPSNAALGIMVRNEQAALEWRQRGARYITIGLESLVRPAATQYLNHVRQIASIS